MALVVEVAVVEAAVGSVELQRERERERLTVSSAELQRGHCQMQKEVTVS